VMACSMHPVGKTDGSSGSRCFEAGESGGIIDHIVGNQNFLPATRLEVARGGVIEAAEDANAGEQ